MEGQRKCKFPEGIIIKPDGIHEVLPHSYQLREVHENVTVIIAECKRCGRTDVAWRRQKDTVSEYFGERIIDTEIERPDNCLFVTKHVYNNAKVKVLVCKHCNEISFAWEVTPETVEDEHFEE